LIHFYKRTEQGLRVAQRIKICIKHFKGFKFLIHSTKYRKKIYIQQQFKVSGFQNYIENGD